MLKLIFVISSFSVLLFFSSCGSSENKAGTSDTLNTANPKETEPTEKPSADSLAPETNLTLVPSTRSIDAEPGGDKAAILSNIDAYLVSSLAYPDPGTITVTNKLDGPMIQKAIAEVVIKKDNGEAVRTDFYILENIEPGGSKSVKINTAGAGTTASCHILKVKSDSLTDGQFILVGSKYSGK